MIVKELIEILKEADPNDIIVLSSDGEGNNYSDYVEVVVNEYNFVEGDTIYQRELTDELIKAGYAEEDVRTVEEGGVNCVVLYP